MVSQFAVLVWVLFLMGELDLERHRAPQIVSGISLADFPAGGYDMILMDPPWPYRDRKCSAKWRGLPYPSVDAGTLRAMPLARLTRSTAAVLLWCTGPFLPLAMELFRAWQFEYCGVLFVWVKTNKGGDRVRMGLGHMTRAGTEFLLWAKRGRPHAWRRRRDVSQVVFAPVRRHSEKPVEVFDRLDALFGKDLDRLELFARRIHRGWDAWGNQVESDCRCNEMMKE